MVSVGSVLLGEIIATPASSRIGATSAATPELYVPTTPTTSSSAAMVSATAAPIAGSEESSSATTSISQPGIASSAFAWSTAS